MAGVIDFLSVVVVVMAIVSAAVALWTTRRRRVALAVLLDLLTAAGMLRLAPQPDFTRAATAGAVLVIRHLVSWALNRTGMWNDHESGRAIRLATVYERLTGHRARRR